MKWRIAALVYALALLAGCPPDDEPERCFVHWKGETTEVQCPPDGMGMSADSGAEFEDEPDAGNGGHS